MQRYLILLISLIVSVSLLPVVATIAGEKPDIRKDMVRIDPKNFQILHVDSFEMGFGGELAIDGNKDTVWHTPWTGVPPKHPHEIIIDMNKYYYVCAVRYLPTKQQAGNGNIKEYELYIYTEAGKPGKPVKTGTLKTDNSKDAVEIRFKPMIGRYIRLVALSEISGKAFTSIAELDLYQVTPEEAGIRNRIHVLNQAILREAQQTISQPRKKIKQQHVSEKPRHPWSAAKGEFQVDAYTTFLAHFNTDPTKADYALGHDRVEYERLFLTKGYFGNCLDLSREDGCLADLDKVNTRVPYYVNCAICPYANIAPYQGTLEFWFQLKGETNGPLLLANNGLFRGYLNISPKVMTIRWFTLKDKTIRKQIKFSSPLKTNAWHYFTNTWSRGEYTIYIDGKIVFCFNMAGNEGIVRGGGCQWFG